MIRIAIIIAVVLTQGTTPLGAETLTCSTWQGIHTCQGQGGYTSTETEWQGVTTGRDNRGNEWTTSHWNAF
jgi:hypothetical protein